MVKVQPSSILLFLILPFLEPVNKENYPVQFICKKCCVTYFRSCDTKSLDLLISSLGKGPVPSFRLLYQYYLYFDRTHTRRHAHTHTKTAQFRIGGMKARPHLLIYVYEWSELYNFISCSEYHRRSLVHRG